MSEPNFEYSDDLPINAVKPYGQNPRRHSKVQIKKLAESIREFGFVNPVLVDEAGELIAGHGRLEAAISLGLPTIRALRITGLKAAQKRALRIADNRLAERSSWSPELLKIELQDVIELDYDVELTGFDHIEVDQRLTVDGPASDDESDIAPPPERPVTRLGDLWALGRHRVICGDARDPQSYARVLCGEKARQVIADVPFNVPIAGHVSGHGRHKHAEFAVASGELTTAAYIDFLRVVMTHARNASCDGSPHYWFIDWRIVAELISVGREVYGELKNLIVWAKPNAGLGALYRSQHELIPVFKHGHAPHVNNIKLGRLGRNRSNLWQYNGGSGFSKTRNQDLADHPTIKATRMIADAIRDASNINDVILDPCAGSGTVNIAAEQVGRRAASIEIEPRFVDVALRRYQQQTGQEPVLLPHKHTLSTVRHRRYNEESDQ
jgi:DNA modification methylase